MEINKLAQMLEALKGKEKRRLVAAFANDAHTIEAIYKAVEKGVVEATLVGDLTQIRAVCKEHNFDEKRFTLVEESDSMKAAQKAVSLINEGKGDMLMKGLVSTDQYMRAILNKENGLMKPKAVLSHVTVIENSCYHKLLVVGDVAVIPEPDFAQKVAITNYIAQTARALGVEMPKIAMISASEQVIVKMQSNIDAAVISKMAERGQIKGAIVDGPLSLDAAIDAETVQIKKVKSEVAGNADGLVFPNIEAGNVFYKTNTKLADSKIAAVVMGAKVPAILSSRGDSAEDKLNSIALAALLAQCK